MKKELFYLICTFLAVLITFTTFSLVTVVYSGNQDFSEINTIKINVANLGDIFDTESSQLSILQSSLDESQNFYDNISKDLDRLISESNDTKLSSLRTDLQSTKKRNSDLKQEISLLEAQLK